MQTAQTYLEVVKSRGERRLELERVYRNLRNRELYLSAYAKLYANRGATTPGVDQTDTVDGMNKARIERIIQALEAGEYHWKPSRRVYIQKANGKLRPLGLPSWSDKLLQEAIRTVLNAYYEPQFSTHSHGFRPGRSCHTALLEIRLEWQGTKWFIEGDIKGCFDNIDHQKLLAILGRSIKDDRFLKLMREMLAAGYLEDWRYNPTLSGTPQGGVISPLLANIFLNELDQWVEQELISQYTRGERRRKNPEYHGLMYPLWKARKAGDSEAIKDIRQRMQKMSAMDTHAPDFRRLRYVRYADDFLLGFSGPYSEAVEIKEKLRAFLSTLGLTLSEEKTLITNATTERARFLGYDIGVSRLDSHQKRHNRSVNGKPCLEVPPDVIQKWKARCTREGKVHHRPELLINSDYEIVMRYQQEFQGLVNFYTMAYDVSKKTSLVRWVYMQSLAKTLANKHRTSVTKIFQKHMQTMNGRRALVVKVPRDGKPPLVASFGANPIRYDLKAVIKEPPLIPIPKNELVERLLADECEVCGSHQDVEVHHIRKLSDLRKRYQGRPEPPFWVQRMMALRRKTLVVCRACHLRIHSGKHDGAGLK